MLREIICLNYCLEDNATDVQYVTTEVQHGYLVVVVVTHRRADSL